MKCKLLTLISLSVFMVAGAMAPADIVLAADTPEMIALGKALFFDNNLSTPHGQSCATCHLPRTGFADPNTLLPVAQGAIRNYFGSRNVPSTAYAGYSPPLHYDPTMRPGIMEGMYVGGLFWDGRVNTLEEQAVQPFFNVLEMHNADKTKVVKEIGQSYYAALFRSVFGPNSLKSVEMAFQYAAEAIAAYERSSEMNPFSSKYDFFLDGKVQLTAAEANGLALFTGKARCMNCHSMDSAPGVKPLFTNFGHQNTGVPRNSENLFYKMPKNLNPKGKDFIDLGLGAVVADPKQNGKFKIPSLRNVGKTPPYMHNGVFKTIQEVIVFNNTRDVPGVNYPPPEVPENVHRHMPSMPGTFGQLGLTDAEINDLVAFLKTLSDGYSPAP